MLKNTIALSLVILSLSCVACDQKAKPAPVAAASPAATPSILPAGLFLTAAPDGAANVRDAKPDAKIGSKVTIVGRIGGSKEPFVDNRAVFTLVDARVKACGEGDPDDQCPTPWDYCCESRKDLTANTITVRIVGPDGQPLKAGLKDVQGLKPLARVSVVGTVAMADGESVVVNASGMHVAE